MFGRYMKTEQIKNVSVFLSSPRRLCFHPCPFVLLVCLFVNKITQTLLGALPLNLVEGCGLMLVPIQNRPRLKHLLYSVRFKLDTSSNNKTDHPRSHLADKSILKIRTQHLHFFIKKKVIHAIWKVLFLWCFFYPLVMKHFLSSALLGASRLKINLFHYLELKSLVHWLMLIQPEDLLLFSVMFDIKLNVLWV